MKLERLTRLIAGYNQAAQSLQQDRINAEEHSSQAASQNAEAVKVAQDFGASSTEYNPEIRRRKIEEIKNQVANGTYYRDSYDIAGALARELF